jgi:hypothetical protein
MALKIWDGFDHYNAAADLLARSGWLQWQIVSTLTPTISFVTGLTGFGKALRLQTSHVGGAIATDASLRSVFQDRNQEGYFGIRVEMGIASGGALAAGLWLEVEDTVAGTPQFSIHLNENNYAVEVWAGNREFPGSLLAISSNNVWPGTTSFYLELGIKIHNSAGFVKARVDGVLVANLTGIDTMATANAWFDAIEWQASPIASIVQPVVILDDLYYADTTTGAGGFAANTFLGDVRVATLFATADDSVQWTPNAGANNYSRINEIAMDGDTTYVSATAAAKQDTYVFDPLVSTIGIIYGLQITFAARKDDGGSRVVKSVMKSGGTTDFGGDHSLANTYTYFTDQWILDPNTSANWTRVNANAVAAGINLVS